MKGRRYVYYDKKERTWYTRVPVVEESGVRRHIKKRAKSLDEAKEKVKNILQELTEKKEARDQGGELATSADVTFDQLANFYEQHYCKPAEYVDGKRVAGLRDVGRAKTCLARFREYFGSRPLAGIRYVDLRAYYLARLKQHTFHDRPPTIATMNRELGVLRRIFRIGVREEWIRKNPFNAGEPLISPSAERMRERILSLEEEKLLLEAIRRPDVRALIICLLDTGARLAEFLKHLSWDSVNFNSRAITIHAMTTKTLTARKVIMTERMRRELLALWEASSKDRSGKVFNRITRMVQRDFRSACEAAGLPYGSPYGITIHSLRHTAATRLVKGQMPLQMVGRILGHSQPQTTYRYLSADAEATAEAARILEALQTPVAEAATTGAELVH